MKYLFLLMALLYTPLFAQTRELAPIDSSAGIDEELEQLLQPYRDGVAAWDKPIGWAADTLPFESRHVELGAFVTDTIRVYLGGLLDAPVDLAVVNSGGIRTGLGQGDVSYNTITEILPFENTLEWTRISGAQFLELGAFLASRRGYNPVSGVRIFRDAGDEFLRMELLGEDGVYTEVDPEAVYTIASINFLTEGNAGFEIFTKYGWVSTGIVLRDAVSTVVEQWTADGKSIHKPENSRRYFIVPRDNPTIEAVSDASASEETVTP